MSALRDCVECLKGNLWLEVGVEFHELDTQN